MRPQPFGSMKICTLLGKSWLTRAVLLLIMNTGSNQTDLPAKNPSVTCSRTKERCFLSEAHIVKYFTRRSPRSLVVKDSMNRFSMSNNGDTTSTNNGFTLQQICELLDGTFMCGEEQADQQVYTACGCDLMSDVLAFTRSGSVLLTGLTNMQVIRTAEMLDLKAVVFVRSKRPDESVVEMARSLNMVLVMSPHPLYESCGRLFAAGMPGCQSNLDFTKKEPAQA